MKMVRTLSALALSAMLVGASVLPASAAFQQSVLDGIILIRSGAPDADGTMTYWQGTGFFVGEEGQDPQYIVTNCHVVEDFILAGKALGGGELHVLFDQDDEAEAYLVDYDAEKDLAVLRLAEPTDKRAPLSMRGGGDAMLGDEVYGKSPEKGLSGQCLHARELKFIHPRTGECVHLTTELPEYFTQVLSKLGPPEGCPKTPLSKKTPPARPRAGRSSFRRQTAHIRGKRPGNKFCVYGLLRFVLCWRRKGAGK